MKKLFLLFVVGLLVIGTVAASHLNFKVRERNPFGLKALWIDNKGIHIEDPNIVNLSDKYDAKVNCYYSNLGVKCLTTYTPIEVEKVKLTTKDISVEVKKLTELEQRKLYCEESGCKYQKENGMCNCHQEPKSEPLWVKKNIRKDFGLFLCFW